MEQIGTALASEWVWNKSARANLSQNVSVLRREPHRDNRHLSTRHLWCGNSQTYVYMCRIHLQAHTRARAHTHTHTHTHIRTRTNYQLSDHAPTSTLPSQLVQLLQYTLFVSAMHTLVFPLQLFVYELRWPRLVSIEPKPCAFDPCCSYTYASYVRKLRTPLPVTRTCIPQGWIK